MFATQQYMDMGPDYAKKRPRDDPGEADTGPTSFGEHRNKRLQCLPLRTSPRAAQQSLPPDAITPLNANPSSSSQRDPRSHHSPWSSSQPPHDEVDMVDSARPSHLQADTDPRGVSARMPTPIQPSFAAQVRGQHCEWAGPGPDPASAPMNGLANMGHHQAGFADAHCVPRSMADGPADWHAVQNNRRLPSPISEADDASCPGMMLDGSGEQGQLPAQLQSSSISAGAHSPQMHAMEHPNAVQELESLHAAQSADGVDGDPESPSPSRKGHARSKHTVNTWTWQPGMKRSFSIGYRSDCEKCRLKVPGHFNHIIIS